MKSGWKLLVFHLLLFVWALGEEVGFSVNKRKDSGIDRNTLNFIYNWIYRISNRSYFNKKYFDYGLFHPGKGVFFFDMECVRDYSGKFFLEIPKTKYIDKRKYKYRFIPISDVDRTLCSRSGEIYRFRIFRDIKDRVFDVKHNRVCYLSSLMVCVEGRKKSCFGLTPPSFLCRKKE